MEMKIYQHQILHGNLIIKNFIKIFSDERETWVNKKYVEKIYALSETQRTLNNSLKSKHLFLF